MMTEAKKIQVGFYSTGANGTEPVREWLRSLSAEDRRLIGLDLRAVEYRWPLGMPTVRPMKDGLFEVRTNLSGRRIVRLLFCIQDGTAVMLHGFFKTTQATPKSDLDLARKRQGDLVKQRRE